MHKSSAQNQGFTLIELSIVLVIIGLIVGGVLVGQSLISSAAVRAQISQIEKYQTATNTFRGKYGYLPGDIPNPYAAQFGFLMRGSAPGQGDGNGLLQAAYSSPPVVNYSPFLNEEAMFWVDLSTAQLIDGSFSTATPTATISSTITGSAIAAYMPQAKIGNGGYVYVWSGGWKGFSIAFNNHDGYNYFGLAGVTAGDTFGLAYTVPLLTVAQAYAIDSKMDDGLPQSGSVTALIPPAGTGGMWASGGPLTGTPAAESYKGDYDASSNGPILGAVAPRYDNVTYGATPSQLCFSNGDSTTVPEQYSVGVGGGANVNCWLSFRFQ
jgi:prepilin-type N-terminal cleavage/methylation domain-containing protein